VHTRSGLPGSAGTSGPDNTRTLTASPSPDAGAASAGRSNLVATIAMLTWWLKVLRAFDRCLGVELGRSPHTCRAYGGRSLLGHLVESGTADVGDLDLSLLRGWPAQPARR
jgi:hypothetical protein